MENGNLINKELVKKYGKAPSGEPLYRLVQNFPSLTEKRKGEYNVFAGDIFIRRDYGVLEVPKYNYIAEGIWILEKFFYTTNPELCDNRSYEPLRVFTDPKTGGYQRPNLRACIFLIECALRGPSKVLAPTENERIAKETEEFYEYLGGKPGLDMAFKSGEAVSYSGLDAKEKLNE